MPTLLILPFNIISCSSGRSHKTALRGRDPIYWFPRRAEVLTHYRHSYALDEGGQNI